MYTRRQLHQRIKELKKEKKAVNLAGVEVKKFKRILINRLRSGSSVSEAEFKQLQSMIRAHRIKASHVIHELNSLTTQLALIDTVGNPLLDRIVIGAGVAATCLLTELPRESFQKKNGLLPAVLVLNDPKNLNQWPKDKKTLMGQHYFVQTPQALSVHSEDYVVDEEDHDKVRNPYQYVMADDFTNSLLEN